MFNLTLGIEAICSKWLVESLRLRAGLAHSEGITPHAGLSTSKNEPAMGRFISNLNHHIAIAVKPYGDAPMTCVLPGEYSACCDDVLHTAIDLTRV